MRDQIYTLELTIFDLLFLIVQRILWDVCRYIVLTILIIRIFTRVAKSFDGRLTDADECEKLFVPLQHYS